MGSRLLLAGSCEGWLLVRRVSQGGPGSEREQLAADLVQVRQVRAVGDFRGKLELLKRGQRWVICKIEESLATISDPPLRAFLAVMAKGHHMNIGALDDALKEGLG